MGRWPPPPIRSGKLGKLLVSRGLCYKPRESDRRQAGRRRPRRSSISTSGSARRRSSPSTKPVHYNWHWFWDFGNGDIGNQGVHQMDIARWVIPGADGACRPIPGASLSLGGRFGYHDQGQTPNTQISVMDFGDAKLIFEVRGLETAGLPRREGRQHRPPGRRDDRRRQVLPEGQRQGGAARQAGDRDGPERSPGKGHFGNFIAAVRSRKADDLNADILEGHYSASLCHLANLSYRLGADVPFNKASGAFGDDKDAVETLARMEEHLTRDGIPADGLKYRVGRTLNFDPGTESFVGDAEANRLLTRAYRAPFVVPDRTA